MTTPAKIRAKEKEGEVTVKILMNHPMETGMRKDKKSGQVIPAHYIETVTCKSDDRPLVDCNWSGTVSKNPYLSFKYDGKKGETFTFFWQDNLGESGEQTVKVS